MSAMHTFSLKTEVVSGVGTLERLREFHGERVGIVTDALMVKLGVADRVRQYLSGSAVTIYDKVTPDPPIASVKEGARELSAFRPTIIIGLGGGSAIDAAKAILAILREMNSRSRITFIAIPTTSGTGSEVTAYSVISDPEKGTKFPLVSDDLIPDIALLEPEFVRTVPPQITADTGMDVLTHALEAYVAHCATDFSDALAEKAVSLTFKNLPVVFADGQNVEGRIAMHNASCMAGMAFNSAGLGLNHGLAHAIGGRLHIPHGRINAMLLPYVIAFNAGLDTNSAEPAAERYARLARLLDLEGETALQGTQNLIDAIVGLNKRFGVPLTLKALGADMDVLAESKDALVASALADFCTSGNPRKASAEDVRRIIEKVAG
ncbi:1-propanol dehydrogenase PduQ [Afifella sp. YEN Y35]|uniref:1-propanol dehydrogenase PduQ n=1 Tax=Afifella sp. YEN Y35 TaxID=3388337 RepID=UPI0039E02BAE